MKSFLVMALLGLTSAHRLEKKAVRRLDTVLLRFVDEEGTPFDHDDDTALQLKYDESDFEPPYDTAFGDEGVVNFVQLNN